MRHAARRTAAAVGMLASAGSVMVAAPVPAATLAPSQITVHATDTTPASGQTFRLYGLVTSKGDPLSDAVVRVKTLRDDAWVRLPGAVVQTNTAGQYRVRVILQMKGTRLLRVVADPAGTTVANSRADLTVTVH
ncbi:MAG: hypothetical protein ACTHOK_19650 [Nocardioidaceae bacterium]